MAISKINSNSLNSGVPASSNMPTGSVLQVVSANLTNTVSTSSSSFVTTGLSVSITPKFSTSKIFVVVGGGSMYNNGTGGQQACTTIYRNGTNLAGSNGLSLAYASTNYVQCPVSMSIYDSPATTSSTTYEVYFASVNVAGTIQLVLSNSKMTITLMEIAG